jgi:hypothetical protein
VIPENYVVKIFMRMYEQDELRWKCLRLILGNLKIITGTVQVPDYSK